MLRKKFVFVFLGSLFCLGSIGLSQRPSESQEIFSPFNAQTFHKIAYELYNSSQLDSDQIDQAITLLRGAMQLDPGAEYVFGDLLNIISQSNQPAYSQYLLWAFNQYAGRNADLVITDKAVRFLLESLNLRMQRETVLVNLLKGVGEDNAMLSSELAIQLALLSAEKADFISAANLFARAYAANPYDKLAFVKYKELSEQLGHELPLEMYVRHMRLAIRANPLDLKAVLAFARYSEKVGLYNIAADTYEYAAQLFGYLWPGADTPASIYLPWALANYNTRRGPADCLEIARRVRQSGRFDIVLEAIAAKAALKMGDTAQSNKILLAGRKAEEMYSGDVLLGEVTAEQISWFYSFASPNQEKALAWSNRAYSNDPNSPSVRAIFAYALAMNDQKQLAEELLGSLHETNQIAAVTKGMLRISADDKEPGIENLKSAVAMDATSLAAERAKILLNQHGSEYILTSPTEMISASLRGIFGERVVPRFKPVDKMVSAKLSLSGSDFPYGGEFEGKLVITNMSSEPITIFNGGMLKGNIRVDADIRGDINASIPELISKKIRPNAPIEPQYHASIPLDLMTGQLRMILLTYPQASLEIDFYVYLDPVTGHDGKVRNSLPGLAPIKTTIKRNAVLLTERYLMQRLDALEKGKERQKVRVAQLFVGLLMEQYEMAKSRPLYRYIHVPDAVLTDAVRRSLNDENWKVKFQSMAALLLFSSPLDYKLLQAVSDNLSDNSWPVRVMALYVLGKSKNQSFSKVLDWTAKYDSNELARNMAVALGGKMPEQPADAEPGAAEGTEQGGESQGPDQGEVEDEFDFDFDF